MLLSSFRFVVWATVVSSIGLDACAIVYTFCAFRLLQDHAIVSILDRFLLYAIPIHFLLIIIVFLFRFLFKKHKTEVSPFVSLRFTRLLEKASQIIGVVYSSSVWLAVYNGVEKGTDLFYFIMVPICIPFFAWLGFLSIKKIWFSNYCHD